MKLLKEKINDFSYVLEGNDGNPDSKRMYIEGIFMMGEIVNENGRKYPIGVLEKASDVYTKTMISKGRSVGELNHPDTPNINYERAAIKTVELRREGNNIYGKALVLSSAFGPLIAGLISDGVQVGVSSRGLASVDKYDGVELVQEDFLICAAADVVSDPSAPDAFVNHVMEAKEWLVKDGLIVPKLFEETKTMIDKAKGRKSIDEAINNAARLFSNAIRFRL